ncbi:MAG: radical SAM protein [Candidatus Aureabacteria bacterium]|nr:radical SAM protein [Candidatus Auribacterota bacterium]
MDSKQTPLGLLYLGAGLKAKGHDVSLLDLRLLTSFSEYRRRVAELNPDIVGIGILTPNRDYSFRCAEIAKEMGRVVIGGGVYATEGAENMVQNGHFDYVIVGEGDISLPKLIVQIQNGKPPQERIIDGERVKNLDDLAFPDLDLYDMEFISTRPWWRGFRPPAVGMICSRGCPAKCTFCWPLSTKMFGSKIRYRSLDNIMAEIINYKKRYDIKTIHFYDDTFPANQKLLVEFCEKMQKGNMDIDWTINSRSDTFSEEIARALSSGGCRMVSFGFESGSQKMLDFLQKGISVEQSFRAAALCKKYKIPFLANILVGIPGETESDYEATYRMIKRMKPDLLYYNTLMPTQGTAIHDYCKEHGLLKEIRSFDDYSVSPHHGLIKGVDYNLVRKWWEIMYKGKTGYYLAPYLERFDRIKNALVRQLGYSPNYNRFHI